MRLRKHMHWLAALPLATTGAILAFIAWWPPLIGHTQSNDGRMYFSSSPTVISSCDANRDGMIDAADVSIFKLYWKGFPEPEIDCNRDGFITSRDLAILMGSWTGAVPAIDPAAVPSTTGSTDSSAPFRLALPATQAGSDRKTGERFTVLVMQTANSQRIAAGEAIVTYDPHRLLVRAVRTSPSIWTQWAERPQAPYGARLVFAGGRPGGFSGSEALIAEIEFEVLASGDPALRMGNDSLAFQPDLAGTPLPGGRPENDSGMVYDGEPPTGMAAKSNQADVQLAAIQTPTPNGPRWIVDLSALADPNDVPSYEVEDGQARGIQTSDAYVLQQASLESHALKVYVHHADGRIEVVNARIGLLPGQPAPEGFWSRLGFWIALELVFAGVLIGMLFHRR